MGSAVRVLLHRQRRQTDGRGPDRGCTKHADDRSDQSGDRQQPAEMQDRMVGQGQHVLGDLLYVGQRRGIERHLHEFKSK